MLSIYISPTANQADMDFYLSLPEDKGFSILPDDYNGDLSEVVRCSCFRDQYYKNNNCLGHPDNAIRMDVDDWRIADFMFTAPRSVSIQGCIYDESKRIIEAHNSTVTECLELLEKKYSAPSYQKKFASGNLLVALVPHMANRYTEMDIHSHALVFNETHGIDGEGCALNLEKLLGGKRLAKHYLSRLEGKIHKLGYPTRKTMVGFEIEGYSDEQLSKMSSRSQEILDELADFSH